MYKIIFLLAVLGFSRGYNLERDEDRIVGGEDAEQEAYPYQVALILNTGEFFCGGFIISPHTVVSAAHCIHGLSPGLYTILAGSTKLSFGGGVTFEPYRSLIHPDYSFDNRTADVSLIFTVFPMDFNATIQPIDIDRLGTGANVEGVLTGWGRLTPGGSIPNDLQVIKLKTIENSECQSKIGSMAVVRSSMICTMSKEGEGACNGDYGGPLVVNGTAVGIYNWGYPCARGIPDVYSRTSTYYRWIDSNIEL